MKHVHEHFDSQGGISYLVIAMLQHCLKQYLLLC